MKNLEEHIMFYIDIIGQLVDRNEVKNIVVKFYDYQGYNNLPLIEKIKGLLGGYKNISFETEENITFGNSYYSRLRFMISIINQNGQEFDYIDGGFTDWTSRLLNNKKERLLTSGIGTDYLLRTIKTYLDN